MSLVHVLLALVVCDSLVDSQIISASLLCLEQIYCVLDTTEVICVSVSHKDAIDLKPLVLLEVVL